MLGGIRHQIGFLCCVLCCNVFVLLQAGLGHVRRLIVILYNDVCYSHELFKQKTVQKVYCLIDNFSCCLWFEKLMAEEQTIVQAEERSPQVTQSGLR